MEKSQIDKLTQELHSQLRKALRVKRLVTLFKFPMYFCILVYFLFIIANVFTAGFFLKDSTSTQYGIFILFAVIFISQMFFSMCYVRFAKAEDDLIRKIISSLFPSAIYYDAQTQIRGKVIGASKLFPSFGKNKNLPDCCTYGSIRLDVKGIPLNIYDIGVSYGKTNSLVMSNSATAYFGVIYRAIVKPMFSSRVDSAIFSFRGMFSYAQLKKDIKASVLIFPDHLETKLGYLAQNIQSMKNVSGHKLVALEDPEFEKYYAVYSDDEVASRYILTPLMMQRLTNLRKQFGRDVLLSFCNDGFYFAVNTPEGFLCLRDEALKNNNVLKEIYEEVNTAIEILNDLKLKKDDNPKKS